MSKCKYCKETYTKKNLSQPCCLESDCISKFYAEQKDKKILDQTKKRERENKSIAVEKIKTKIDYEKELQKEINTIVRLIDKNHGCISCGGNTTPQAGHYHTVKSNGSIRFNLHNLHVQDYNCNCAKSGNIPDYDLGLIKRFNREYWEYVKFGIVSEYPLLKINVLELKEKTYLARGIVKRLKLQERCFDKSELISLRNEINKEIGIYTL